MAPRSPKHCGGVNLDLTTFPAHLHALEMGRDSGELVATERVTLVQDASGQPATCPASASTSPNAAVAGAASGCMACAAIPAQSALVAGLVMESMFAAFWLASATLAGWFILDRIGLTTADRRPAPVRHPLPRCRAERIAGTARQAERPARRRSQISYPWRVNRGVETRVSRMQWGAIAGMSGIAAVTAVAV